MKTIPQRLKEIRTDANFPQKVVAAHIGINRSNYSRIENNLQSLTAEQLKLFCEFFDISADYILGIKNSKVTYSFQQYDSILRRLEDLKNAIEK